MYTKKEFGRELAEQISKDFNLEQLSTWAHDKYLVNARYIDGGTYDAIMTIVFLSEEGFSKTKDELLKLAAELQKDI